MAPHQSTDPAAPHPTAAHPTAAHPAAGTDPAPSAVRRRRKGELRVPRLDTLTDQLRRACGYDTSLHVEVPLTALGTAVVLLGAPSIIPVVLQVHATQDHERTATQLRLVWEQLAESQPYLDGHLDALLGWVLRPDPRPGDLAAYARCAAVLADVDILALVESPGVGGEVLGPVYTLLRSAGSRSALGAFYTPMSVCTVMAAMVDAVEEGGRFCDPTAGAGAMAVAAVKHMRSLGRDPRTVTWVLNDLDPIAVALAGINASVHGMGPRVVLRCGNGLDPTW